MSVLRGSRWRGGCGRGRGGTCWSVIEDDEGRGPLGGDGVVVLADDLVLHVQAAAADPRDPDADMHRVGIGDLAAVIVGHRRQDRADPLGLVHVHQADLEKISDPGRLVPAEVGDVVHMPECVLLAPLHGLDHHHGELGKHGLHLLFGVHGVAWHSQVFQGRRGTTEREREPRKEERNHGRKKGTTKYTKYTKKRDREFYCIRKNKLNYVMNV